MQLRDRIGKRIRLQDMHILMAVIQAGSMGKAARRLNISQPNISKSVADLERELGVRLLDRYRQGVKPTEGGRALLDGGTIVFDKLRQTVKNIEFFADPAAEKCELVARPQSRRASLRLSSTVFPAAIRVSRFIWSPDTPKGCTFDCTSAALIS